MQCPPRERAGDVPLPHGHLHHAGGPEVEVQPLHLRPGVHHNVALLRPGVVAHRLRARRLRPHVGRQVDAVRQQPQRLRLGLSLLHRDGDHHRVRLPGHHGQVPRGHPPAAHTVRAGLHRERLHGRLHVRQDLAAQEARRDAGVLHQRGHLHAGRPAVPDVPRRGPAELAHRGGVHPSQDDQVEADQGRGVHPPQPDGHQRGLRHRGRPALPGVAAHHLPRDQPQESLLGDLAGPPGEGRHRGRGHSGRDGGSYRHDVPGQELLRDQRDQVGPPLHARAHPGGRLLRGGLQQLPRRLRDQHAQLQRPGAVRHAQPRSPAPHLVAGQPAEPAGPPGEEEEGGAKGGNEGPRPRRRRPAGRPRGGRPPPARRHRGAEREERRHRQHRERVQSVVLGAVVLKLSHVKDPQIDTNEPADPHLKKIRLALIWFHSYTLRGRSKLSFSWGSRTPLWEPLYQWFSAGGFPT